MVIISVIRFINRWIFFVNMDICSGRIMSSVISGIIFRPGFMIVSFRIMPLRFGIIFVPGLITIIIVAIPVPVIIRPGQPSKHKDKGDSHHCGYDYFVFHNTPCFKQFKATSFPDELIFISIEGAYFFSKFIFILSPQILTPRNSCNISVRWVPGRLQTHGPSGRHSGCTALRYVS